MVAGAGVLRQGSPINLASTRAPLAQTAEPCCVSPEHTSMFVHFQRIIIVERAVCGSPPFSFCFPSQSRSSSAGSLACVWQALLERDYQRCCERQADAATQYRHLFERRQEALVMKRSSVEVRGLGGGGRGGGRLARCGFCGKPWEWETSKG